ncbi:hypothetical protein [Parasphingorhabdus pacifica]
MMMRIPTPGDVFGLAKSTVGWAVDSTVAVTALPGRVIGLVDEVETLLTRVNAVVDRADELIERTAGSVTEAEGLISRTREVAESAAGTVQEAVRIAGAAHELVVDASGVCREASGTVEQAQKTAATADGLLATYAPIAQRAAPMAERFVEELSPKEVDAAIRLVDELPVLTEHVLTDILPILGTLDRVGPEIHELLEVTHDVRRAIVGIPGFQFFRRRGQGRVSAEDLAKPEPDELRPVGDDGSKR